MEGKRERVVFVFFTFVFVVVVRVWKIMFYGELWEAARDGDVDTVARLLHSRTAKVNSGDRVSVCALLAHLGAVWDRTVLHLSFGRLQEGTWM